MSPSIPVRVLATQTDDRLVELAAQGHDRAFEALVLRYRRALLGYCRGLPLSGALAEDAVQQGLMQAWLALQAGTEVRDPKPWLYRIVRNAALNMRRGGAAAEHGELAETLCANDGPEDELYRRIAIRGVLAGLAALPEQQREALLRTAVEGHSHEQVAATLGLSDGAVRGLIYRARATLRAAATAITPTPLLNWALSSGTRGGPSTAALVELSAGGGSAGLAGLLLKGGVVAATAGALATSIGVSVPRSARHHAHHVAATAAVRSVAPHRAASTPRVVPLIAERPPTAVRLLSADADTRAATRARVIARPASEHANLRTRRSGGGDDTGDDHSSATTRGGSGQDGTDGGPTQMPKRSAHRLSSATRNGSGDGASGSGDGGSGAGDGGSRSGARAGSPLAGPGTADGVSGGADGGSTGTPAGSGQGGSGSSDGGSTGASGDSGHGGSGSSDGASGSNGD